MKHLDLFYNDDDFLELYKYVSSLTNNVYAECGKTLLCYTPELAEKAFRIVCTVKPLDVPYDVGDVSVFDQLEAVLIEKMARTDYGFFHPGGIVCKTDSAEVLTLYNRISGWVKRHYRKAFDTAYYIGPNLYLQWKEQLVEFHFFVDADTFTADASDFSFQWLYSRFSDLGYIVKENRHDVRLPETAFSENVFVIHAPNARLHSKLVSRRLFLYPDSEAVFFRKEEKKNQWRFIVDARHFDASDDSSVKQLWNQCLELLGRQEKNYAHMDD